MAARSKNIVQWLARRKSDFPRINKKYIQLRTVSQVTVNHGVDDVSTGSEMPFMVPPQAIKKGFQVHQSPRSFTLKPDEKMMWLTKTYLTKGLPDSLESPESTKDTVNIFRDNLHQIAAFQINPARPSRTFHEEEFSLGLLQEMLRMAMMTNPPQNQDLFIHRKPQIETNWFRNYVFFHAKYEPSFVLRISEKLPAIKSIFPLPVDEFPLSMPGPFDTYSLGAYETSIIRLKNNTGVHHTNLFKKRHIHTVLQVDTTMKDVAAFQSCGLMTSFTNLLAIAQDLGHPQGLPLTEPLNCNCVITNGTSILLMVYQLNTTELNDDRGVWNRAWCTDLIPLYTPKEGYPTKTQFHEIADIDKLENFNEDVIVQFLKLLRR